MSMLLFPFVSPTQRQLFHPQVSFLNLSHLSSFPLRFAHHFSSYLNENIHIIRPKFPHFPSPNQKHAYICTRLFIFPFCHRDESFPLPIKAWTSTNANRFHLLFSQSQQFLWLLFLYFLCYASPYSLCSSHMNFWQSQEQTKLFPTQGFWHTDSLPDAPPASLLWLPFSRFLDIGLNINPSGRSSFFYLKLIPNPPFLPLSSILTSWLLPYCIYSDLKCLFVHLLIFGLFLPLECKLYEAEYHPAYHFFSRTQHSALYIVITKIGLSMK